MEISIEDKIRICPACNTAFTCSPVDCWCSKLPNVMPMTENADCYCQACLERIISSLEL